MSAGSDVPPLSCVGFLECVEDGRSVVFGPVGEVLNKLDEGAAEFGEVVLDSWRDFGVGVAADQAVAGESSQRVGEDLSGDAADEFD